MAELLLGRRDHRYVHRHLLGREPRERLERHVDAGAVVEAPRGDAVVCELERRARPRRSDRPARRGRAPPRRRRRRCRRTADPIPPSRRPCACARRRRRRCRSPSAPRPAGRRRRSPASRRAGAPEAGRRPGTCATARPTTSRWAKSASMGPSPPPARRAIRLPTVSVSISATPPTASRMTSKASCSWPDGPCAQSNSSRSAGITARESSFHADGARRHDPHRPAHAARRVPAAAGGGARELPARVGRAGSARAPLVHRLRLPARLVRGGRERSAGRSSATSPTTTSRRSSRRCRCPTDGPGRCRRAASSSPTRSSATTTAAGTATVLDGDPDAVGAALAGELVFQEHKVRARSATAACGAFPTARRTRRACGACRSTSAPATRTRSSSRSGPSGRPRPRRSTSTARSGASTRRRTSSCSSSTALALVGSSPETLVKCEAGTRASTRSRATTEPGEGDAERLLASEKDRAEHVMLVDLGRNDLSRVCRAGTVQRRPLPRAGALLARDASRLRGDGRAAGRA